MTKNFYSATSLIFFINNKDLILEFREKLLNLKKSEKTILDKLRIEKGLLHEAEYFKHLSKKYKKVKNIKSLKNLSRDEKIKETNVSNVLENNVYIQLLLSFQYLDEKLIFHQIY